MSGIQNRELWYLLLWDYQVQWVLLLEQPSEGLLQMREGESPIHPIGNSE